MHKIIHYREKCIGCGVCFEQQPDLWRMSKKDGKATLVNAGNKKNIYQLEISDSIVQKSTEIAVACPVRIIKII